jgi:alpha-tubulin suppressor-like RCC1 family protein
VIAIAAGGVHSMALKSDGTVLTWGFNGVGQLGLGTNPTKTTDPRLWWLPGWVAAAA